MPEGFVGEYTSQRGIQDDCILSTLNRWSREQIYGSFGGFFCFLLKPFNELKAGSARSSFKCLLNVVAFSGSD